MGIDGGILGALADFAGSAAGEATIGGIASSAVGFGLSKLNSPKGVTIPPPPGSTMLDAAGSAAAAMTRQRQAAAGGLNSTITGAGLSGQAVPGAGGGPTSGGKSLLGT